MVSLAAHGIYIDDELVYVDSERERVSATYLSRRKKVDPGDRLNGSVTVFASDQSVVFQILTLLSSD